MDITMEQIGAEAIAKIIDSIFSTMMDVHVSVVDSPRAKIGDRVISSVHLEGTWNGAVSMQCSRRQACEFAGKVLCMDTPEEMDNDVRDAVGEIVNMIGGNMKAAMGRDVRLSLPTVIDGCDYEMRVCGSAVEHTVGFNYSGGDFWVTVLVKDSPRAPECN
jgi:chemotaxis protein CheX